MKNVPLLAFMLLLACGATAVASTNLWVISLRAATAGFESDFPNMVGVSTDYTDGVDSSFDFATGLFRQEGVPPPTGMMPVTQLRVNASNQSPPALGGADIRTPLAPGTLVGGTASKTWSFTIFAAEAGNTVDPGTPYTVTIMGIGKDKMGVDQIPGADLPYELAGSGYATEYSYAFSGGIIDTFDVNHQLDVGHAWTVTGNTFGLTVTATNLALVPEPGSLLVLGSTLVGIMGFSIHRRK